MKEDSIKKILSLVIIMFFLWIVVSSSKVLKDNSEYMKEMQKTLNSNLEKLEKMIAVEEEYINNLISSKEYIDIIDAEINKLNDTIIITLNVDKKPLTLWISPDNIIFEGDTGDYTSIKDFLDYRIRILSNNDGEYSVAIKNE